MSVCSGAFLLAQTGLLDGRRATTHWMYAGELAHCYPEIDVDPNVLFVDAGNGIFTLRARPQASTCACTSCGSTTVPRSPTRWRVGERGAPATRRGQAQFVDAPVPATPDDDVIGRTLEWAAGHLHEPPDG